MYINTPIAIMNKAVIDQILSNQLIHLKNKKKHTMAAASSIVVVSIG